MNKAALLLIALLATPSLGAQPVRIESPGYSLERTIGREPLDPSRLPEGATISHLPWREFQVEVVKVPEVVEGQNVINRNVMLPLKPSAIQLRMVGVADLDAEMDALLPQILAKSKATPTG